MPRRRAPFPFTAARATALILLGAAAGFAAALWYERRQPDLWDEDDTPLFI